jgi:glycosyltransferase involved in cell wall biosynthesis
MTELSVPEMASGMIARGVKRVHVLAWRDFEDAEAGGSEDHAHEFMTRWQQAGLSVLHRTSHASGQPATATRSGYEVVRRGGRMSVFPRTMLSEVFGRMGRYDALVEIWNGVPWMSPLWCRRPHILILHHVHGPMWNQIFSPPLAAIGRGLETKFAPPFYRRTPTVTTSEDTREELLHLGWKPELVTTGPVGVDDFFSAGGTKTTHPSIVAVGRQAPVKRFVELMEQVQMTREFVPGATLTLVGDGPDRTKITEWIDRNNAREWVIASASLAEGWGLALTEAAGCGTPAVATDISGHRCSVLDGQTGLLAPLENLGRALADVLLDDSLRAKLSRQAESRARTLTWDALAAGVLHPLYQQVINQPVARRAT